MIQALVDALKAEFGDEVELHTHYPSQMPSSAIVIVPGDPFLTTSHHGLIEETWDVLVTAKLLGPDRGVNKQRELSLRVRKAVGKAGALWVSASSPRWIDSEQKQITAVVNVVKFDYDPKTITDSEESS